MRTADRGILLRQAGLHVDIAREKSEAEIRDLDHLESARQFESGRRFNEQQIGRLDVTVDDARGGRVRKAGRRLADEFPRHAFRERPLLLDRLFDVDPLDQLHHKIESALMPAEIVGGHDIRMP